MDKQTSKIPKVFTGMLTHTVNVCLHIIEVLIEFIVKKIVNHWKPKKKKKNKKNDAS